jgi:cation:H+ antiporter
LGNLVWLIGAFLAPLVWLVPHHLGVGDELSPLMVSTLAGITILAAAFLLTWATELAERDIPPAFALVVLALVSVLPEYAVDMTFAWRAGKDPTYLPYAVANMTGANRVLIGIGWSFVVFLACFKDKTRAIEVSPARRMELGFLLLATIFSFILPIFGELNLGHSAVFILIFLVYVVAALRTEGEEHPLIGPAALIDEKTNGRGRWAVIVVFLVYACLAIWWSAAPFAEGLVQVGRSMDIDEFILIQLVAPLASESPEFIIALLFVLRGRTSTALGALISSKVNQWTLLVGAIPIVYSLSVGKPTAMPLDHRQIEELLLTSAQSMFAIAILSNLRFSVREAAVLFVLFVAQWFFPSPAARYVFAAVYLILVLGVGLSTAQRRREFSRLLRLGPGS